MGLLPELKATDVIFLHCPACAFQTHFLSRLGEHFEEEHAGSAEFQLYRCPQCHRVSSSLAFMREHLEVMHEVNNTPDADDINVYFTGKLYSQRACSPGPERSNSAGGEGSASTNEHSSRRCVFCCLRASSNELAEHYMSVHGVANVYYDRVCGDPVVLMGTKNPDSGEENDHSATEMMESDDTDMPDPLPSVKSECNAASVDTADSPTAPPVLHALPKADALAGLSLNSAHLTAAYHLAHATSSVMNTGGTPLLPSTVALNSVVHHPVTLNSALAKLPAASLAATVRTLASLPCINDTQVPVASSSSASSGNDGKSGGNESGQGRDTGGECSTPGMVNGAPIIAVSAAGGGCSSNGAASSESSSRTPDPGLTIPSPSTLVDSFSAVMNPSNRMIPRVTLSERAKNVLFQWLLTHLNEPYPSEEDKGRLATLAGVNRTTVSNWFINARRRYIRPMKEGRLPPNNDFVRRVQRYTNFIQQQQRSLTTAGNVKNEHS